jgi:hypothetical protein
VPIHGTLGEKYLAQFRGLSNYHQADIRFIKSVSGIDKSTGNRIYSPAILSIAKNDKGELNHVQVVRLNNDGSKNNNVKITKQTYGQMQGFAVDLNTNADKSVTYLAEGVETGLSILNTHRNAHVLAVLGKSNFVNMNVDKLSDKVVICLDNDFKGKEVFGDEGKLTDHIKAMKRNSDQVNAIAKHFKSHGKDVRFILPDKDKFDFNDVLQQQGYAELSKQINQLITEKDYAKITDQYIEMKLHKLNHDMDKFIESIKNEHQKLSALSENQNQSALKSLNNDRLSLQDMQRLQDKHSYKSGEYNNISINDKHLSDINKHMDSQLKDQIKRDQIENIIDKMPKIAHKEMPESQSINKEIER